MVLHYTHVYPLNCSLLVQPWLRFTSPSEMCCYRISGKKKTQRIGAMWCFMLKKLQCTSAPEDLISNASERRRRKKRHPASLEKCHINDLAVYAYWDTVSVEGAHTHTPFLPCNIHQVIAYWYATMSVGISVMNAAQAFELSTLPLCQLGYLFNQRVIWMQAEWDGGGRYRDYTLFNPVVSWKGKDPSVIEIDSPCNAFSPPPISIIVNTIIHSSKLWVCVHDGLCTLRVHVCIKSNAVCPCKPLSDPLFLMYHWLNSF